MKQVYVLAIALACPIFSHADDNTLASQAVHQLPELVVSASLWDSELANTTASVSIFDGETISENGSQHFEDIINAIPNLTWTAGSSRPRYIQIRGIGENSQYEGETPDSSVRFLVDDLDFTGLGTIGNLFDVQQVEVLRGAQVGAFGANAAGGIIKIVTNQPTSTWTGQAETTVGEDNLTGGGLAFGGPLLSENPEVLTFRIALHQLNSNGFRKNAHLNRNNTNNRDEFNSRLKLSWKPSVDWQWDTTLFYADLDNGYDEWSLNNTGFTVYSDLPGRDEQESFAGSLRGSYNGFDSTRLTTITSFSKNDNLYSFDGDWGAENATAPANSGYVDGLLMNRTRKVYSEELRLDSEPGNNFSIFNRWTIGFYGQAVNEKSNAGWQSGLLWNTDFESKTFASFGQAIHEISETQRLTIQLRGEYYEVAVAADGFGPDQNYLPTVAFDYALDSSEFLWGGSLTYEEDLANDALSFVSLSRGYKAGGASTPNFNKENITYKAETLWTAETGIRNVSLSEGLTGGFTFFYTHRENPQFRDSAGSGSYFDYITVNGKTAQHYGIESDLNFQINPNWAASLSVGILHAEHSAYDSISGREIANAPSYTYSARLDYNGDNNIFGNLTLSGSDDYFESNSHDQKRSAFNVLNASLGYRLNTWTFTLWAKNLLDTHYEKRIFYFDNYHPDDNFASVKRRFESPADPQQFGASLNYRW
jgi:outer membrane receptor protein involved in Fe transport